jgi:Tfp pilus assembly protein PilN
MPTINLIYEQRIAKRQREQRSRMLVTSTLGVGAFLALLSGYFMFESARLTIVSNQIERRRDELKDSMKQVEENQAAINQLKPRLTTLETALKDTERWSRLMAHLTVNTPSNIKLTQVRCNQPDKSKALQVSFTGTSSTQEEVGVFILRLEAAEDLENVVLKFTQEKVIEGGKAIEFEVTGDLVGSAPPKKKVEEKT